MFELTMPSFGADMDDGEFVQWHVAPGQAVRRGEIVAIVETQKGAIDVEVWQPGTIARLIAEPGQRIAVGRPLALLADEGEDWQVVAASQAPPPPPPSPHPPTVPARGPRASPAARKRAGELGIELSTVVPSSPEAPISLADVERSAPTAAQPSAADGMRAAIAAAMTHSKREIPHYYLGCEVDVERAHAWLERLNEARPVSERVLFAALALHVIARALRETPQLNGRFVDGRFIASNDIHLGVVTSLRAGGLVVPTVHAADTLDLAALMAALHDAIERARSGRLRSSDLADSTMTVSNLGDLGVETVYGVIYPPQVAIVGLGRVAARPVVRDGLVVAARTLNITLAADHRASDGLVGARFLARVRALMQNPEQP